MGNPPLKKIRIRILANCFILSSLWYFAAFIAKVIRCALCGVLLRCLHNLLRSAVFCWVFALFHCGTCGVSFRYLRYCGVCGHCGVFFGRCGVSFQYLRYFGVCGLCGVFLRFLRYFTGIFFGIFVAAFALSRYGICVDTLWYLRYFGALFKGVLLVVAVFRCCDCSNSLGSFLVFSSQFLRYFVAVIVVTRWGSRGTSALPYLTAVFPVFAVIAVTRWGSSSTSS